MPHKFLTVEQREQRNAANIDVIEGTITVNVWDLYYASKEGWKGEEAYRTEIVESIQHGARIMPPMVLKSLSILTSSHG